ncbi:MAG TPA: transposase [Burkholderiales bacterium]|nr:transposase [Burkholderiales bacterium]
MARLPRFFVQGETLHVIQRGNNRIPIFSANHDYLFFLDCLQQASTEHGLVIHAYVLMSNHVHILASPQHEASLPKTFQSVGRRYVQHFNHAYKRTGTLWEGRYRATLIDSEHYLLTCMLYIELNPVRAGMVDHPADYPWSSYQSNATQVRNTLVTPHELYLRLGQSIEERNDAYKQLFHAQLSDSDVDAIRDATQKAWVLGSDPFRNRIEARADRRATPLSRGRPPKDSD